MNHKVSPLGSLVFENGRLSPKEKAGEKAEGEKDRSEGKRRTPQTTSLTGPQREGQVRGGLHARPTAPALELRISGMPLFVRASDPGGRK